MPQNKITSLKNPKIKQIVHLRNRREREQTSLTIVEGYREILRAIEAGIKLKELYVCYDDFKNDHQHALVKRCSLLKVPIYSTQKSVFSKVSYGDRQEGLLAVFEPSQHSFQHFQTQGNPLYVVIEQLEKPGNLGAILRTCDGAGVDGVIICDGKTDIYNPNVIRASLGAIFSLKVVLSSNEHTYHFLKSRKVKICAASPTAQSIYTKVHLTGPLAIIVGSEQKGLSDFWIENSDLRVRIPMKGQSDSLNVSTSTAILIYEAIRQRGTF